MLDTLKLRLSEVTFKPNCDLELKPATTNLRTGESAERRLLFHAGDVAVVGAGAFHNSELFNFDVSPNPSGTGTDVSVHFSVAGVAHSGNNYHAANRDQTAKALETIQSELHSIGVETDLRAAYLSRTDLFRNIETDQSYRDYQPLFGAMTPQRMKPADYGTGFRWGNSAHQVCVYSKLEEMAVKAKKQRRSFDASQYPANVLRFEWRLYGRDKSRSALAMETGGELLDRFDELQKLHKDALKKQLFKRDLDDRRQVLTVAQAEAGLRHFIEAGERYWFERWWSALPLTMLDAADLENVIAAVEKVAPNRETPRRVREKLKAFKMDAIALKRIAPHKPTMAELYRELEQKLMQ